MSSPYAFDWADLAFGSRKAINELRATFILAPRELSAKRFTQLVKTYLPKGNIVLGISGDPFVAGLEGQPQFRLLSADALSTIIGKVNASASPYKIYTLQYYQRETDYLIDKLKFRHVVLVNGSWHYAFHNRSTFYAMVRKGLSYDYVSPFADEDEARDYEQRLWPEICASMSLPTDDDEQVFMESEMLGMAAETARQSYDYSFQTGIVLGKASALADGKDVGGGDGYRYLISAFNKVVPYQTYALHHGASREQHFSPPHDLNHYDTVHAEVELLIAAQQTGISLEGTTVFINLLPCPPCARMLSETSISELVYREDHSDGYAIKMLELAGKTVRRVA